MGIDTTLYQKQVDPFCPGCKAPRIECVRVDKSGIDLYICCICGACFDGLGKAKEVEVEGE